jgi:hypothetical protein
VVIAVASGKGGTGKTTFSVNLAYVLAGAGEKVRLLDCDVEEPNDHLFVKPVFTQTHDVHVLKPVLDKNKCTGCGKVLLNGPAARLGMPGDLVVVISYCEVGQHEAEAMKPRLVFVNENNHPVGSPEIIEIGV